MKALALFKNLQDLKIELTVENGSLNYAAPKGALTPALMEAIKENKEPLIRFLTHPSQELRLNYNRLLLRFKEIEAEVEASPNQHAKFSDYHDEWLSLGNNLSKLLNQIGSYTNDEALNGFSCHIGGSNGK